MSAIKAKFLVSLLLILLSLKRFVVMINNTRKFAIKLLVISLALWFFVVNDPNYKVSAQHRINIFFSNMSQNIQIIYIQGACCLSLSSTVFVNAICKILAQIQIKYKYICKEGINQ